MDRWNRLAASLNEAGFPVTVNERSYPGGTSRYITMKVPGHVIEIHDTWWRENWTGWQVWLEDTKTAIAVDERLNMKKRSGVVAAVREFSEKAAT